jgi:hypothetical protein
MTRNSAIGADAAFRHRPGAPTGPDRHATAVHGGAMPAPQYRNGASHHDFSATIVHGMIMVTMVLALWDLYLLGTHLHG